MPTKSNNTIKKYGLTLIEVLLAIFVFGVGILGILQIMTQNIGLMDRTKLRAQATLLSQEGMELVFHHRDTNVLLGYNRECAARDSNLMSTAGCSDTLTSDTRSFIIQQNTGHSYQLIPIAGGTGFSEQFEQGRLYVHNEESNGITTEFYNNENNNSKASYFSRVILFDTISPDYIPDYLSGKIIKATVTTLYMKGSLTGSVTLETLLGERVY